MLELSTFFSGKKVLITGHTGFKGSWLSLWLASIGARVIGISKDVPTSPSHYEAAQISTLLEKDIRLDIRNRNDLEKCVSSIQPDFIFHLAAQPLVKKSYDDPVETWEINTMGTVNMLEAMKGITNPCVAVMITSDKCYDNLEWIWGYRETDALGGPDPYSASKAAAELAIRSYVKSFFKKDGFIRIGIGRAGNVIGGGDWAADRIVPDSMRAWSEKKAVELRNPSATRPWQHVLEPLSGYIKLAVSLANDSKLHGEPFNFGPPTDTNQSVGVLVSAMSKYWELAQWNDISSKYGGPNESTLLKLNCDKALYYLSWKAVWNFEQTVKESVLWYMNYYQEPNTTRNFSISQIKQYVLDAQKIGMLWGK
jgi:CDP-glucose 4,6-dehydratase